jgi:hypothetical protein
MVGHTLIDRGQLEAGERACRRALEIFPLDYRAMTGLAEAQMWRKNWKEVIAWGQKSFASLHKIQKSSFCWEMHTPQWASRRNRSDSISFWLSWPDPFPASMIGTGFSSAPIINVI